MPLSIGYPTTGDLWQIPNFSELYQTLWDLPVGTKGYQPICKNWETVCSADTT